MSGNMAKSFLGKKLKILAIINNREGKLCEWVKETDFHFHHPLHKNCFTLCKRKCVRNSLEVQRLGLHILTAKGPGSIHG